MLSRLTKWTFCTASIIAASAVSAQSPTRPISSALSNAAITVRGPAAEPGGTIVVPESDVSRGGRTTYKIFVPNQRAPVAQVVGGAQYQSPPNPPQPGYYNETPASLACIYGLAGAANGCNPNTFFVNASGGSKVVCIVAFGHDTTALADLQAYSTQFGLPQPNLTIMYPSGSAPANDQGDALETSLDLDMAHAMSPNAPLILVEGTDSIVSDSDFGNAVNTTVAFAVQRVQAAGGGVISISYGGPEFSTETQYEPAFSGTTNVSIFASAGDAPGTLWPAVSPNVVAVGGTGTARATLVAANAGTFKGEVAWDQTGGGFSPYHSAPSYQAGIAARIGNMNFRATPDISGDADPATAVWVYCTSGCGMSAANGWTTLGGTSVASPLVASAIANAGFLGTNTAGTLTHMYARVGTSDFYDVGRGLCGPYAGYVTSSAVVGNPQAAWDLCTGLGSPRF